MGPPWPGCSSTLRLGALEPGPNQSADGRTLGRPSRRSRAPGGLANGFALSPLLPAELWVGRHRRGVTSRLYLIDGGGRRVALESHRALLRPTEHAFSSSNFARSSGACLPELPAPADRVAKRRRRRPLRTRREGITSKWYSSRCLQKDGRDGVGGILGWHPHRANERPDRLGIGFRTESETFEIAPSGVWFLSARPAPG